MCLLPVVLGIAQTMIEEITLPLKAHFMGDVVFPLCNRMLHAGLWSKTHQRMEMIRHEQKQMRPPIAALFPKQERIVDQRSCFKSGELVLPAWRCADGDEIYSAIVGPCGDRMRQFFPFRQHGYIVAGRLSNW